TSRSWVTIITVCPSAFSWCRTSISARPLFIVNKKYVVAKDRQFPEFADYLRQLLTQDKE
ncbi:hypothetical protein V7P28_32690, partial [Klebsiella michiganensis]